MSQHTDREFESELRDLRQRLLLMAGRTEEIIVKAVRAFVDRDRALAQATIELDARINADEIEIDDAIIRIMARRQPMASDLRFLAFALKMVTDLERIADLAVNICERTMDLAKDLDGGRYEDIPRMAEIVESMVRDAIDAFVNSDSDLAWDVVGRDDEVDDLYQHVLHTLVVQMQGDPDEVRRGTHVQSVAKYLERMADHSTNLAEQVIFMVLGEDIRHIGKLDTR